MPRKPDPTSWRPALAGVLTVLALILGWGATAL